MTLIVVAVVFMKTAIAAGIGTVGTGSSLTAAYMLGAFDPGDATLPDTVDKFKEGEVGDCVKGYFPGLDVTKVNASSTSTSLPSDFSSTSGSADFAKSCLVVNGERENFSNDAGHGKGNFRWLGSFVKGNRGFVMFNVASSKEDTKMELKGVLYVLKKNDSGEWTSESSSTDATASKQIIEGDFDDSFPKVSDPIKSKFSSSDRQDGWNFVKKDDMKNLCKSDDNTKCKDSSGKESFKGLWTWESSLEGTDGSLTNWSSNLDKGVPNLYTGIDLKNKLSSLKGKWNDASVFDKDPANEK